ncbi:MAG: flagellar protein FliS [Syntrophomonas sp.]
MSVNARIWGANDNSLNLDNNDSDKLLVILLNNTIKNIENAIKAIEESNFNRAHVQVIVAQEMLSRWVLSLPQDSLNTKNLNKTHDYLQSKLSDANIKKDTGILEEIRCLMILLSDFYRLEEKPLVLNSLSEIPLTRVFSETG